MRLKEFDPTTAQQVAALVDRPSDTKHVYMGAIKSATIRLPLHTWADLKRLAHLAEISQNSMYAMVMDAGLQAIKAELSDKALNDLAFKPDSVFGDELRNAEGGRLGTDGEA